MGLLGWFSKKEAAQPPALPNGSMTMDRNGVILTSTLQKDVPKEALQQTGLAVLHIFREAKAAGVDLTEIDFQLGLVKIKAREMRGGAMIFFSPRGTGSGPKETSV